MDPNWAPVTDEERTVYGLKLKQRRNDATITEETFKNVITMNKRVNLCVMSFMMSPTAFSDP